MDKNYSLYAQNKDTLETEVVLLNLTGPILDKCFSLQELDLFSLPFETEEELVLYLIQNDLIKKRGNYHLYICQGKKSTKFDVALNNPFLLKEIASLSINNYETTRDSNLKINQTDKKGNFILTRIIRWLIEKGKNTPFLTFLMNSNYVNKGLKIQIKKLTYNNPGDISNITEQLMGYKTLRGIILAYELYQKNLIDKKYIEIADKRLRETYEREGLIGLLESFSLEELEKKLPKELYWQLLSANEQMNPQEASNQRRL